MKLRKMLTSSSFASVMIVTAFSASAEGYVTLTKDSTAGFAKAVWSETVEDPSTRDYLVADGHSIRIGDRETVNAHSLTFGVVGGSKGIYSCDYSSTFENEGLVLANGRFMTRLTGPHLISGKITITSPADEPFLFDDLKSGSPYRATGGMKFPGSFSGAETVGIVVTAHTNGYQFVLAGDASEYKGSVIIGSEFNYTPKASAIFRLEGVPFGGSVTCGSNTTVEVINGAASIASLTLDAETSALNLSQPLVVGDLTLAENVALNFKIDGTSKTCSGTLTVTNKISYASSDRIPIRVSGWTSLTFPPSDVLEIPVLTIPGKCGLDVDDFVLDISAGPGYKSLSLSRSMDDQTGFVTISLAAYPQVWHSDWPVDSTVNYQATEEVILEAEVSMMNSTGWKNGLVPQEKTHYAIDRYRNPSGSRGTAYLRTPYLPEGSYDFPGESIYFNASTHLLVMAHDFSIPRLDMENGNTMYGSYWSDVTVHGDLYVGSKTLTVMTYNGHCLTVDGTVLGSGLVKLSGHSKSANDLHGYLRLSGTNAAYTGKVLATIGSGDMRWKGERYVSLYVSDARNFGGPRTEFACDALKLANMAELIPERDVTFDDQTRGLMLTNIAQLTVQDANVLTLKQPVTVDATVYKNGTGTLAMGGTLKFVDADAALTDVVPETAANHMLIVTGGTLKPIAARSMDGLDIVFTDKGPMDGYKFESVSLAIDAAATDAEFKQYGFINLKTANPLTIDGKNLTAVPVMFENLPADPKEAFSVPVCTVRKSAAADVLALLVPAEKRVMLGNVKAKITLSASESFTLDGFEAVTIKADVTPPAGLMLLVR